MAEETEAQVIADTATAAATPHELDTEVIHSVVVPNGAKVEILDLEKHRKSPFDKRGAVTLFQGESLTAYVNRHKDDQTQIYADVEAASIVAVLNDHGPVATVPGWADHRATLKLRTTPEWERWIRNDGNLLNQVAFAELIEVGYLDIVEPPAADMLELAQTFQARSKAEFRSATVLQSGQRQLRYEETIDAKAGTTGQIEIPPFFTLGIAPFEGTDPYRIKALLRYRLSEGHLSIGYILERPQDVLRSAFADIVGEVAETTSVEPLYGAAPAPRR
jgi:uncharacterized protein YfdQ (DUF2303 family)